MNGRVKLRLEANVMTARVVRNVPRVHKDVHDKQRLTSKQAATRKQIQNRERLVVSFVLCVWREVIFPAAQARSTHQQRQVGSKLQVRSNGVVLRYAGKQVFAPEVARRRLRLVLVHLGMQFFDVVLLFM